MKNITDKTIVKGQLVTYDMVEKPMNNVENVKQKIANAEAELKKAQEELERLNDRVIRLNETVYYDGYNLKVIRTGPKEVCLLTPSGELYSWSRSIPTSTYPQDGVKLSDIRKVYPQAT